jgi:hypothetical protein
LIQHTPVPSSDNDEISLLKYSTTDTAAALSITSATHSALDSTTSTTSISTVGNRWKRQTSER